VKVLVDYHHHDLWESLRLLFNKRLGWELLRPIGMDWFEQGYWNHERKWHGDAIARQYLEPWGSDQVLPASVGTWRNDYSHADSVHHLVTLDQARDLRPDIVISSLAHNHDGFARFASEVGATFGLQVGNVRFSAADMAEDRWDLAAFGLVSGFLPVEPPKPHVVYHQEFSLTDFAPVPPPRENPLRVSSFVQCYPQDKPSYEWWQGTAQRAPEFAWSCYGAYGEAPLDQYAAGNIDHCAGVAKSMQASDIAWHAKRWSDGYGHVIHNWFAIGRPVFGFESYYRDQMAGPLWKDGETSIDIGRRSPEEIVAELRRLRDDPERHLRMCEAAAARFREVVNFDEEAERIRAMFAQVLP
jgi:hypothetical protein